MMGEKVAVMMTPQQAEYWREVFINHPTADPKGYALSLACREALAKREPKRGGWRLVCQNREKLSHNFEADFFGSCIPRVWPDTKDGKRAALSYARKMASDMTIYAIRYDPDAVVTE